MNRTRLLIIVLLLLTVVIFCGCGIKTDPVYSEKGSVSTTEQENR
ncbi:MAG: hypothetical protein PVG39_04120 [Desulfobacteraceae bacterium]